MAHRKLYSSSGAAHMINRDLIKMLLDKPMDAPVFIDLNDDANKESAHEINHVSSREGPLGPVVVLDADWGKHVGG